MLQMKKNKAIKKRIINFLSNFKKKGWNYTTNINNLLGLAKFLIKNTHNIIIRLKRAILDIGQINFKQKIDCKTKDLQMVKLLKDVRRNLPDKKNQYLRRCKT